MTTMSRSLRTSSSEGYVGTPASSWARGWMATTRPRKPASTIERSTVAPIPVPSDRTPTTATEEGRSIGSRDLASALNSRSSARSIDSGVAPVPSVSTTVPMSKLRWLV